MQINSTKEFVVKGIYNLLFNKVKDFGELNHLNVDTDIVGQLKNNHSWFIIQTGKEMELSNFINNLVSIGFSICEEQNIVWNKKDYHSYKVTVTDENILRIVNNFYSMGYKSYSYYDTRKRMSIESWSI